MRYLSKIQKETNTKVFAFIIAIILCITINLSAQSVISSLPYEISQSNQTYVLNSDLTSQTNGISFAAGVHDVILDMNGHELTFGSDGGDGNYGIFTGWSAYNLTIQNGSVFHDKGLTSDSASGNYCIRIGGGHDISFIDVNATIDGIDGKCVFSGENSAYNIEINGGIFTSNVRAYSDRCLYKAAVIKLLSNGSSATGANYNFNIHNIEISKGPHVGIFCSGLSFIHDNFIRIDAVNEMYDTTNYDSFCHCSVDPFCIAARGLKYGSKIYNNTLRSGTEDEGSQGIIIEQCIGTANDPIEIYNNDLELWNGPNLYTSEWRGSVGGQCVGIFMRDVDGFANEFVKVYNNTIEISVDDTGRYGYEYGTQHIGKVGEGLRIDWIGYKSVPHDNLFEKNHVVMKDLSGSNTVLKAMNVSQRDSLYGTTIYGLDDLSGLGNNIIRYNYYESPHRPLNIGTHNANCCNVVFESDTINLIGSRSDAKSITFDQSGCYRFHSTGNRIRDCVFLGSASDTDVKFAIYTATGGERDTLHYMSLYWERSVSIKVVDELNNPIDGAEININNNYGKNIASGFTNGSGIFTGDVIYRYEAEPDSVQADSTGYGNFTISAAKGTESNQINTSINSNTAFPLAITLNSGGSAVCEAAPSVPTLSAPNNGATVQERPTLCVNNSSGGLCPDDLTYDFQISTNSSMSNIVAQIYGKTEGSSITCYAPTIDLNQGQTYYWRARAYNGTTYSNWMSVRTIVIETPNTPPTTPIPNSPAGGGSVNVLNPVVVAHNSTDADGDDIFYTFQVAMDVSFSNIVAQVTNTSEGSGSTTLWTVSPNLTDGVNYYWRVLAYDGEDYSSWSVVSTFTVDLPNNVPTAPVPSIPLQGAMVSTTNPTLSIANSTDADGDNLTYTFQVSINTSFTEIAAQQLGINQGGGATTSWTASTALSDEITYYWRARAYDGEDYSSWSSLRSFIVNLPNNAPSVPIPTSPSHGEYIATHAPNLRILNSVDLDGDDITYHFQVSTNSSFSQIVAEAYNVNDGNDTTEWNVNTTLANNTNYWWRSRAYDGEDLSSYSQNRVFYVDVEEHNDPPAEPDGASPPPGTTDSSTSPILTVNNATDPEGDTLTYHFEVWNDTKSQLIKSSLAIEEEVDGTTSWQVDTSLDRGKMYNWRCRTFDGNQYGGYMDWSDFEVIQINSAPSHPDPYLPEDGDILIGGGYELIVINTTDPDGDELKYEFRICSDPGMDAVVENVAGIDEGEDLTTSFSSSVAFSNGGTYYWQARVFDGMWYSSWSTARSFTHYDLVVATLDRPVPVYPLANDTVRTIRPQFIIQIEELGEGENYFFEIADNPEFNLPITSNPITGKVANTSWTPSTELSANTIYYWRARAEETEWSETNSFLLSGNIHVIPNPYKPDEHGDHITFKNIPNNSKIQIFTISGDLVKVLNDVSGPDVNWDCYNTQGVPIATGVYLYTVEFSGGMFQDKFAVIR